MPTYEYVCRDCGHHLEVVQSFREEPLTTCAACGGPLRKVFSAAGIIFKGSGYYITDSREKPAESRDKDPAGAKDSPGNKESSSAKAKDESSSSTAESA
jgi:putative FmdB family regulatory protein